jgi:hypothetical protein
MQLPEAERKELGKTMRFNGTTFGKGVYRAFVKNGDYELTTSDLCLKK